MFHPTLFSIFNPTEIIFLAKFEIRAKNGILNLKSVQKSLACIPTVFIYLVFMQGYSVYNMVISRFWQ
jgi:hypothetical protein